MKHLCQLNIITVTLLDKCNNPHLNRLLRMGITPKNELRLCFFRTNTLPSKGPRAWTWTGDSCAQELQSEDVFLNIYVLYWTESFRKLPNIPINQVCKQTSWKEVYAAVQYKLKSSSFICIAVVLTQVNQMMHLLVKHSNDEQMSDGDRSYWIKCVIFENVIINLWGKVY